MESLFLLGSKKLHIIASVNDYHPIHLGELTRHVYESMRREAACLRIQTELRMYLSRKAYKELCSSAVSIRTRMRGMAALDELRFRRQTRAAIVIQCHCRKLLARLEYVKLQNAAITTKCAWRGRVALKELRKLKMAARETGALQAAKNKFEKQVEELTWRLQLEKQMRGLENGHHANESSKPYDLPPVPAKGDETHDSKPKRPPTDRQHEDVDALMECVVKDVGFSQGKPVAAFTMYKCLLHWKTWVSVKGFRLSPSAVSHAAAAALESASSRS